MLADHSPDDLVAVGIACPPDPRYLIYIGTIGCASGRYHVELESLPLDNDDFPYTPPGSFDSVDYAALPKIVTEHLGRGRQSALIDPPQCLA